MAGPAVAQGIPVYDSSGYLQALATVKNTLSMIDQGKEQIAEAKQLYGSFNQVTDVNGIASSLSTDAMRHLLPRAARDISRLMSSANASRQEDRRVGKGGGRPGRSRGSQCHK